jgi:site-specific recombinase XerD
MKLSTGLNQFFVQYLPHIKGSRQTTIHAYRDTYRLFLPFAADYHQIKIASLRIEHLTVELIIAFLNHLEQKRKNTARTRNLRLVAIKSLAKMIRFMRPQYRKLAEQILSIPQKRMQKKLIGYLYPEEIMDVFKVVDLKKRLLRCPQPNPGHLRQRQPLPTNTAVAQNLRADHSVHPKISDHPKSTVSPSAFYQPARTGINALGHPSAV